MNNNINQEETNSKPELRICIINSSGNSGKTISGRFLIQPRLNNPKYYKIGRNSNDIKNGEVFFTADQLASIYENLTHATSAIVEIEISAYESTTNRMFEMKDCHKVYDFFLVPIVNLSTKLINDSLRTIENLIHIGVPSNKIKVLFNTESMNSNDYGFDKLLSRLDELETSYNLEAQFQNYEFYQELDTFGLTLDDLKKEELAENKVRLDTLKKKRKTDGLTDVEEKELNNVIHIINIQRKALKAIPVHDKVFELLFSPEVF